MAMAGTVLSFALFLSACSLYGGTLMRTSGTVTGPSVSPSAQKGSLVISYSNNGFSPNPATVKVSQAIEFKNDSGTDVQVNSANHPTHLLFPELNIGVIAPGESKSVTLTKPGTYKYHNHLNASQTGTIIVE